MRVACCFPCFLVINPLLGGHSRLLGPARRPRRHQLAFLSPLMAPAIDSWDRNARATGDLSHALPVRRAHPPSHISLDGLAVTTHWSCPQALGVYV
jgi:hypothetical protein